MGEHLKALIVILMLATPVFMLGRAQLCPQGIQPEDFDRRRNLWVAVTLAAFLSHNFWIYILVLGAMLGFLLPRERNPLALFFFLLLALPAVSQQMPTFGVVETLFMMTPQRMLALAVLVPAFFSLLSDPRRIPFGRLTVDKFFIGYLVLQLCFLAVYVPSPTVVMRETFYLFVDYFVIYYVASRSLREMAAFRDALTSIVVAAAVMAPIALFEYAREWLLYYEVENIIGSFTIRDGVYMSRAGGIRAVATGGHTIVLGYAFMVAVVAYMFVAPLVRHRGLRILAGLGLVAGLVATFSRGPWIAALVGVLVVMATGPRAAGRVAKFAIAGVVVVWAIMASPVGNSFMELLPFVRDPSANIGDDSVLYRQRLFEVSLEVLAQNPIFGVYDYIKDPRMEQMRQSQGIIDMVNSYLGVAMATGVVGLAAFVMVFLSAAWSAWRAMRQLPENRHEARLLGRVLLGSLVAVLVFLATASSIQYIATVYFGLCALCAGYSAMVARALASAGARAHDHVVAAPAPAAARPSPRPRPLAPGRRSRV